VRLGELDLNPTVNDGANPLDVPIEKILPHEEYDQAQLVNDIAVLKLKQTVTFNSKLPSTSSRDSFTFILPNTVCFRADNGYNLRTNSC